MLGDAAGKYQQNPECQKLYQKHKSEILNR